MALEEEERKEEQAAAEAAKRAAARARLAVRRDSVVFVSCVEGRRCASRMIC